jgi:hypothetical protein
MRFVVMVMRHGRKVRLPGGRDKGGDVIRRPSEGWGPVG